MSSRLFQKLRDEMGIGYYVHASNDSLTDHGCLSVSAGVDSTRVEQAITAIMEEFKKCLMTPIPAEELNRVKEHMIGHLYLGLESSNSLASFYGFQEVLKRPIRKPEEVVAEIRAVTAEQLASIAKEIFQENKLNLAIVGPFPDLSRFVPLLKI